MQRSAAVTGRLVDEERKAVARASLSLNYDINDINNLPHNPLPYTPAETDAEGRFRVEGIFPGQAVTIEFHRADAAPGKSRHYRPESLRKLVLDDGRTRDVGTVTARSSPW